MLVDLDIGPVVAKLYPTIKLDPPDRENMYVMVLLASVSLPLSYNPVHFPLSPTPRCLILDPRLIHTRSDSLSLCV